MGKKIGSAREVDGLFFFFFLLETTKRYIDKNKKYKRRMRNPHTKEKLNNINMKTRSYKVKTNKLSRLDQPVGTTHC